MPIWRGFAKSSPSRFGTGLKDIPSRGRVYFEEWFEDSGIAWQGLGKAVARFQRKLLKSVGVATGEIALETDDSVWSLRNLTAKYHSCSVTLVTLLPGVLPTGIWLVFVQLDKCFAVTWRVYKGLKGCLLLM